MISSLLIMEFIRDFTPPTYFTHVELVMTLECLNSKEETEGLTKAEAEYHNSIVTELRERVRNEEIN